MRQPSREAPHLTEARVEQRPELGRLLASQAADVHRRQLVGEELGHGGAFKHTLQANQRLKLGGGMPFLKLGHCNIPADL